MICASREGRGVVATIAIVAGHLALIRCTDVTCFDFPHPKAPAPERITTVRLIVQSPDWDTVPFPEVTLQPLEVKSEALQMIQFDDDSEDWLSSVIAPSSSPRLDRFQSVDLEHYAQRAKLKPGQPATIVLSLEVLRDGTVGLVSVIRSCGVAGNDAIAVEYAHQLRWFPGTVDQVPQDMRVVYPVTLVVPLKTAHRS